MGSAENDAAQAIHKFYDALDQPTPGITPA